MDASKAMTSTEREKIAKAKTAFANIADSITAYLLSGEQSLENANMSLVMAREAAQDCLGELMAQEKQ